VLDEDTVLEDGDLAQVVCLAYEHHSLDGLPASQELCLGQDRGAATSGCTALTATLPLRLHTCGAFDAGDLVNRRGRTTAATGLPYTHDHLSGIVIGCRGVLSATATTATTAAARADGLVALHRLGLLDLGV